MKKRYTDESQIIHDIDTCYRLASKASKEAEDLDNQADELFRIPNMIEDAKGKRLRAAKTRQRANNLINKKAKKLGEKLAEFRTVTMPIVPDNSIPA